MLQDMSVSDTKNMSEQTQEAPIYLLLEPVDGPLPLGRVLQQVVLGEGAFMRQCNEELDAVIRPPTVVHVV